MQEKEFIKKTLRQIFVVARLGVEDKQFTQEEINAFIADEAKRAQEGIDKMPLSVFMLYCVAEVVSHMTATEKAEDE